MADYSSISSVAAAERAFDNGSLEKILLLPVDLGGGYVAENIVYIPEFAAEVKNGSNAALLAAVRKGMSEVTVVPHYRGESFVPASISVSAARPGMPPGYTFEVTVW